MSGRKSPGDIVLTQSLGHPRIMTADPILMNPNEIYSTDWAAHIEVSGARSYIYRSFI
jgi:hypothetical protein